MRCMMAAKKPSMPCSPAERHAGRRSDPSSGLNGTIWQVLTLSREELESIMFLKKVMQMHFSFLGLKRTGAEDKLAAWPHPFCCSVKQLALHVCKMVNLSFLLQPGEFRMPADCAR
jgi:hypothetical protein